MNTKQRKLREISANLRLSALNIDDLEAKTKLVKIAQNIDEMYPSMYNNPNFPTIDSPENDDSIKPSKFGIDQEQKRYYKIQVEFLYIPASDNLEAREKIMQALQSVPDFAGKFNVGEAQGMSVKEPS